MERLDPQVSRCGRVESTTWYRIDTAPDGLIAVTVKGAAGVAPVLRVYRRGSSAIEEVDCGSAGPGSTATATLETVRGSNYLILVGRRPGTPDGAVELGGGSSSARQRQPWRRRGPEAPGNRPWVDARCDPGRGRPRMRPCGRHGLVPGRQPARRPSPAAPLGAGRARRRDRRPLERVRSRVQGVACAQTDRQGRAAVSFTARRGASYLIVVGHVRGADRAGFRLDALLSEAAERRTAGTRLGGSGARATVHGLTDVNDVWRVSMQPGTTYRIGFSSSPCASVTLRSRSRLDRVLTRLTCAQYTTFTPGPRRASTTSSRSRPARRQIRIAVALRWRRPGPDDVGVGVALRNRVPRAQIARPRPARRPRPLPLRRRASGRRPPPVTGGPVRARARRRSPAGRVRRLPQAARAGRYVVAVSAPFGTAGVAYRLALLIREITSTSLRLSAPVVGPGTPVALTPVVANTEAGTVEIQIDRFDPLSGWQFNRILRVRVGATVSWRPPAEGRWRLRASFGARSSEPEPQRPRAAARGAAGRGSPVRRGRARGDERGGADQ